MARATLKILSYWYDTHQLVPIGLRFKHEDDLWIVLAVQIWTTFGIKGHATKFIPPVEATGAFKCDVGKRPICITFLDND